MSERDATVVNHGPRMSTIGEAGVLIASNPQPLTRLPEFKVPINLLLDVDVPVGARRLVVVVDATPPGLIVRRFRWGRLEFADDRVVCANGAVVFRRD